jgi:hypothetical protein
LSGAGVLHRSPDPPATSASGCRYPVATPERVVSAPGAADVGIAEGVSVYRPRHPERTAFYQLFDRHFECYLGVHEERFEPRYGALRPVVRRSGEAFLDCGRLVGGFARIRCPSCGGEHLLAFSCRTRNFCPSCQAKRAALFAEKLSEEILAPVPHRHVVLTIPRALRGLFERERRLLGLLARTGYEAIRRAFAALVDDPAAVPGVVISIQTFGSFANFHPHLHALATDGAIGPDGTFLSLPELNPQLIEEVFRRLVITRLHAAERLSEEFRDSLLSWPRSGFSAHAEQIVQPDDTDPLERLARYLARAPMPIDAVEATDEGEVRIATPPDPRTGKQELRLDPLDWIHALCQQIPDPRQHTIRYYGIYANRSRSIWRRRTRFPGWSVTDGESGAGPSAPLSVAAPARRASWARLLRRILEVDPLLCPACGIEMKVISVITEPQVVDKILRHIARGGGRDPFEERAPPHQAA